MKAKAELLSLPPELLTYILSFLPWQDILRCTSLCKALRQTYISESSSELQYAIELGSQRLLPVSNNHIPVAKRLQLLRENASAWFKFDLHSFGTISIPEKFYRFTATHITNGHACFWNPSIDSVRIFPILPKPSQETIERDFSPGSLCAVSNISDIDVFMDPAQNLLAIAYAISGDNYPYDEESYIELLTLDGDGVHPQAAGRTLFMSDLWLPGRRENFVRWCSKLEGFEKYIAFLRFAPLFEHTGSSVYSKWCLHIWDWQHSTSSNSILSGSTTLDLDSDRSIDFYFLGNDRLLIISDNLELYSIEDMSRSPQLLARFLFPASVFNLKCCTPTSDIACSSHPKIQAQQVTWVSDPKYRVLSLASHSSGLDFVISTTIFFDGFSDSEGMSPIIPWICWGPSNVRIFLYDFPCRLGVSGNRALNAFPAAGATNSVDPEYRLHMMDFSPSAVRRHQQGLGRLVNEPSTVYNRESGEYLTTFMPYVEVVSDRTFSYGEFVEMWFDQDKIYLFKENTDTEETDQLEVIEL
ncbi:uncharacterized protein F5147DRAFT_775078 [Suillus discolor]|uniref:F-box domain-containing protein n=1 Tax=Suillus discolor TaxID=1912936 RepID=A0A9P7F368_9AGAM|nr:uncharacterized protein F5147DRAFT_775078 [Suillus discolor]KAG2105750.1 hypothetical protein F5147DRAFT_775078 [Suillus discolor]